VNIWSISALFFAYIFYYFAKMVLTPNLKKAILPKQVTKTT